MTHDTDFLPKKLNLTQQKQL